jgi:predicted nucleic acid-binding protein
MADSSPRLYVDANAFIYVIEGEEALAKPIQNLFFLLKDRPGVAITSELTIAEVLPKARMREQRQAYLDLIVWSGVCKLQPISRDILYDTVDYRRTAITKSADGHEVMPRLPDAIHIVTAIQSRCSHLLSGDVRLKMPDGMTRVDPNQNSINALMRALS